MSKWQPIATAPRNGHLALFYSLKAGVFIAPDVKPDVDPVQTKRFALEAYETTGEWPNTGWNPTHWQPLPEPPESEGP